MNAIQKLEARYRAWKFQKNMNKWDKFNEKLLQKYL